MHLEYIQRITKNNAQRMLFLRHIVLNKSKKQPEITIFYLFIILDYQICIVWIICYVFLKFVDFSSIYKCSSCLGQRPCRYILSTEW